MELTPDELCTAYRAELRRLHGDEKAEEARIVYEHGWFYISVTRNSPLHAYRKKKVLKMVETLRAREPRQQTERK